MARCSTCNVEFDVVPMLAYGLKPASRNPVEFVCKDCGSLLGQYAACPSCGNGITVDRNGPGNNSPPFCMMCNRAIPMQGSVKREL
jgi:hypothetical protein